MSQGAPPGPRVVHQHLNLLQRFGKSQVQKKSDKRRKEELWRLSCDSAGLPYVPLDHVIEEWRRFVSGNSKNSGVVMKETIDPNYLTIGICFDGKKILSGSHTMKTKALLYHVLKIYARCFNGFGALMADVEQMCRDITEGRRPGRTEEPG